MSHSRPGPETAAVFALLLAIVWRAGDWLPIAESTADKVNGALVLVVAGVVLFAWGRAGTGLRDLGLAPSQWRRGWGSIALATAVGVAALALAGARLGTVSFAEARLDWLDRYTLGIAAQQLLLNGFFAPRFAAFSGGRRAAAVALSAGAFAALHAPNPALMIGTAIAAAVWAAHFLAHRNLLAVLLSHLVLGVAAMVALGPGPMLNLRVGPGALELLH